MPIPRGTGTTHTLGNDRVAEFVAAIQSLTSEVTGRLNGAALYAMVVAFWGVILYCAIAFAVQ
jgi:hypothetical protein